MRGTKAPRQLSKHQPMPSLNQVFTLDVSSDVDEIVALGRVSGHSEKSPPITHILGSVRMKGACIAEKWQPGLQFSVTWSSRCKFRIKLLALRCNIIGWFCVEWTKLEPLGSSSAGGEWWRRTRHQSNILCGPHNGPFASFCLIFTTKLGNVHLNLEEEQAESGFEPRTTWFLAFVLPIFKRLSNPTVIVSIDMKIAIS